MENRALMRQFSRERERAYNKTVCRASAANWRDNPNFIRIQGYDDQ